MIAQCQRPRCGGQVVDLGDDSRCLLCGREPGELRLDSLIFILPLTTKITPKHNYQQQRRGLRIPLLIF